MGMQQHNSADRVQAEMIVKDNMLLIDQATRRARVLGGRDLEQALNVAVCVYRVLADHSGPFEVTLSSVYHRHTISVCGVPVYRVEIEAISGKLQLGYTIL